jgi:3-hydroxyisobutyrate dehydrogenase-like beta-hydroxyacid dehydrogenase
MWMTTGPLGFIGLGSMGAAIADRFLTCDLPLVVCDLQPDNVAPFVEAGAEVAVSPREVADRAQVVFSCLPTTDACRDVALGSDGVRYGTAVEVYVDTSTIGTTTAREIASGFRDEIGFVDAPVSGGPSGARAGTLSAMVSGAKEHFERALPYLSIMAKNVFHLGEQPGQAQIAKLINNHLSSAGRLAAFEGLVLALKAGIDPGTLIDVINVSSGRNYTTTHKIPEAILSGSFEYNGQLALSIKDETLLQEEADALGVPLWVGPHLLQTLHEVAAAGYLDHDSMFVVQYMGQQAGIDVRAIMQQRNG